MAGTFHILTFGCKSNQYDSQLWRKLFLDSGWREAADGADVFLINTCAVTAAAERQARQAARRSRNEYPAARVIVAGCAGETAADVFRGMPQVDLVVGRQGPESTDTVRRFLDMGGVPPAPGIDRFHGHTRAFIKAQDGCSHACSYCIVPRARGPSRSRDLAEVVAEAARLVRSGHRELVVTGIRLGDFRPSLGLLLSTLASLPDLARLRLSSLEPDDVNDDLIDAASRSPSLARHFHLPLQSGSDRILAAMARPYRIKEFKSTLDRVAANIPGASFGTDLMVGFPGETEEDFQQSLDSALDLPISHLHVFGYSRRPGTRAAVMPGQVPEPIKKERSLRLRQAFRDKQLGLWQALVGSREEVLFETYENGSWTGLAEHYFRVQVPSANPLNNRLGRVRLTSVLEGGLEGELEP